MAIRINWIILLSLLFTLFGCEPGSGEGLDENGNPISDSVTIPLGDNFRSIQANIFTPNCAISGCHSGVAPPEGLLLSEGDSFANLVGQPSNEVPALERITPFDADNSYLFRKITGVASVGVQMPRGLPPLSSEKIEAIRSWINNGALGPALSSIQQNIFTPICTQCHFGANPAGGLNLEDGQAHAGLVGQSRLFDPEIRVVAGDADSSFLIDKLENNNLGGSRGDRMPLGGPFLNQVTIDVIKQWINEGANDN